MAEQQPNIEVVSEPSVENVQRYTTRRPAAQRAVLRVSAADGLLVSGKIVDVEQYENWQLLCRCPRARFQLSLSSIAALETGKLQTQTLQEENSELQSLLSADKRDRRAISEARGQVSISVQSDAASSSALAITSESSELNVASSRTIESNFESVPGEVSVNLVDSFVANSCDEIVATVDVMIVEERTVLTEHSNDVDAVVGRRVDDLVQDTSSSSSPSVDHVQLYTTKLDRLEVDVSGFNADDDRFSSERKSPVDSLTSPDNELAPVGTSAGKTLSVVSSEEQPDSGIDDIASPVNGGELESARYSIAFPPGHDSLADELLKNQLRAGNEDGVSAQSFAVGLDVESAAETTDDGSKQTVEAVSTSADDELAVENDQRELVSDICTTSDNNVSATNVVAASAAAGMEDSSRYEYSADHSLSVAGNLVESSDEPGNVNGDDEDDDEDVELASSMSGDVNETWEGLYRVGKKKRRLLDIDDQESCVTSEWSVASEIGSELDVAGKMAELATDVEDDLASDAQLPDVSCEVGADKVSSSEVGDDVTETEKISEMVVDVSLTDENMQLTGSKETRKKDVVDFFPGKLSRRRSGSPGDDRRLDSIASPKQKVFFAVDIDFGEDSSVNTSTFLPASGTDEISTSTPLKVAPSTESGETVALAAAAGGAVLAEADDIKRSVVDSVLSDEQLRDDDDNEVGLAKAADDDSDHGRDQLSAADTTAESAEYRTDDNSPDSVNADVSYDVENVDGLLGLAQNEQRPGQKTAETGDDGTEAQPDFRSHTEAGKSSLREALELSRADLDDDISHLRNVVEDVNLDGSKADLQNERNALMSATETICDELEKLNALQSLADGTTVDTQTASFTVVPADEDNRSAFGNTTITVIGMVTGAGAESVQRGGHDCAALYSELMDSSDTRPCASSSDGESGLDLNAPLYNELKVNAESLNPELRGMPPAGIDSADSDASYRSRSVAFDTNKNDSDLEDSDASHRSRSVAFGTNKNESDLENTDASYRSRSVAFDTNKNDSDLEDSDASHRSRSVAFDHQRQQVPADVEANSGAAAADAGELTAFAVGANENDRDPAEQERNVNVVVTESDSSTTAQLGADETKPREDSGDVPVLNQKLLSLRHNWNEVQDRADEAAAGDAAAFASLQVNYDDAISSIAEWLDSVRLQFDSPEGCVEPELDGRLKSAEQEIVNIEGGVTSLMPNYDDTKRQLTQVRNALHDVQERLAVMNEERRQRELQAESRKKLLENVEKDLRAIEEELLRCQGEFSRKFQLIPSQPETSLTTEEKQKLADNLLLECSANLTKLDEIDEDLKEKRQADRNIIFPPELASLKNNWNDLKTMVEQTKIELAKEADRAADYSAAINKLDAFLDANKAKLSVVDRIPATDRMQLVAFMDAQQDLLNELRKKLSAVGEFEALVNPVTVARNRTRAKALLERASTGDENLSACIERIRQQTQDWGDFETMVDEESARLREIAEKLSTLTFGPDDSLNGVKQKLLECRDRVQDVNEQKEAVQRLVDAGRKVLLFVDSNELGTKVDELESSYLKLSDEANELCERLKAEVEDREAFESDLARLESFLSNAELQVDQLKELDATDKPDAETVARNTKILAKLTADLNEEQAVRNRIAGHRLLTLLSVEDPLKERREHIEDRWNHVSEAIVDVERILAEAELTLMPSWQAIDELHAFLSTVMETLSKDEIIKPRCADEVRDLNSKYMMMSGDVSDRKRTIAYLDECCSNTGSRQPMTSPTVSVSATLQDRFSDVNQRYNDVCDAVRERVDSLTSLMSVWKEFDDTVKALETFTEKITDRIDKLSDVPLDNVDAGIECLEDELRRNEAELIKLKELKYKLSDCRHWSADRENVEDQLSRLCDKMSAAEAKLTTLKASVENQKKLVADFLQSLAIVNGVLDTTQKSVEDNTQLPAGDLVSLRKKVDVVKTDLLLLEESIDLDQLTDCCNALVSVSQNSSADMYEEQSKDASDRWQKQQTTIKSVLAGLETVETEWSRYEELKGALLSRIDNVQEELDRLKTYVDGSKKQVHLSRIEAILQQLDEIENAATELDHIRCVIESQLDSLGSAYFTCEKVKIDKRLAELRQQCETCHQKLLFDLDLKTQFDELHKAISEFLDGVPASDKCRLTSVDGETLRVLLDGAQGTLNEFSDREPGLVQLRDIRNHIGDDPEVDSSVANLERCWSEKLNALEDDKTTLEHRLRTLDKFKDKCNNWLEYVTTVEDDLSNNNFDSYVAVQEEQTKRQKFNDEKPQNQQTFNLLIGEGKSLLAECTATNDRGVDSLSAELADIELRWDTVCKRSSDRRRQIDELLSKWQSYFDLSKKLSQLLDDVEQFVVQHDPVSDCPLDDISSLLVNYKKWQQKLTESESDFTLLKSVVLQLESPSSSATCDTSDLDANPARKFEQLDARRNKVNCQLDEDIGKLENALKLLDEIRAEIDDMVSSQTETKQLLSLDLPPSHHELEKEKNDLEMLKKQLTDKNRPAELKEKLAGLLSAAPSTGRSTSAIIESSTLSRRLDLLSDQRVELADQVSGREREVDDRLRQWSDWDDLYEQLTNELSSVESRVDDIETANMEVAVARLQNEILPEMALIGSQKDDLIARSQRLAALSNETRREDMLSAGSLLDKKWSDLFQSINARLKKLTDSMKDIDLFDVQMKTLRHWLGETENRLKSPIAFRNADDEELQHRFKELKTVESDIESRRNVISSLRSLVETVLASEAACQRAGGPESLQQSIEAVDQQWSDIQRLAIERKRFLEETDTVWRQFHADYNALKQQLTNADKHVSRFKVEGELFSDIKEMILRAKEMKQTMFQKLSSDLSTLNRTYGELVRTDRTDKAGTLQQLVTDCNDRWTSVSQRTNTAVDLMTKAVEDKENFDRNLQSVKSWLSGLDDELTVAETSADEQSIADKVLDIQKNLETNSHWLVSLDKAVETVLPKCHRSDAAKIKQGSDSSHKLHAKVLAHLQSLKRTTTLAKGSELQPISELEDQLSSIGLETAAIPGIFEAESDLELPANLPELERWLTQAETTIASLADGRDNRRTYKLRTLLRDIDTWKRRVADIRSSTRGITPQTPKTETLCDRISNAMKRWKSVCNLAQALNAKLKGSTAVAAGKIFAEPVIADLDVTELIGSPLRSKMTLEELENWLSSKEQVLHSQPKKVNDLSACEKVVDQLLMIEAEIGEWRPHVKEIRSSTHNIAQQTEDSEQLCERISLAMQRWTAVGHLVPLRLAAVATFLITDDDFRLAIDDLLGQMVDARDELQSITTETQCRSSQQLVKTLTDIRYDLTVSQTRAYRLQKLAKCLEHGCDRAVAREQIDQIASAVDELQSLQQTCVDCLSSLCGIDSNLLDSSSSDELQSVAGLQLEMPLISDETGCSRPCLKNNETQAVERLLSRDVDVSDVNISYERKRLHRQSPSSSFGDDGPKTSKKRPADYYSWLGNALLRACRVAVPFQLLVILLLVVGVLVPVCNDEERCMKVNSLRTSIQPMLRYIEMPPI